MTTSRWFDQRFFDITEAVLRHLEFIFTLLAFSIMASLNSHGDGVAVRRLTAMSFLLASNVIAWLYSLSQLVYLLTKHVTKLNMKPPIKQIEFLSMIFDQVLFVLLLSSSTAAVAVFEALHLCQTSPCCSQVRSSIAMSFMATLCFYLSALVSARQHYQHSVPRPEDPKV